MALPTMLRQKSIYPGPVMALLFLASLDVMLTYAVLTLGGVEANPLAARVIERGGTLGMSVYKFTLITFFVLVVEYIGSRQLASGRRLAAVGIAISLLPVLVALMILPGLIGSALRTASARDLDAAGAEEGLEAVAEDEVVLGEFQT